MRLGNKTLDSDKIIFPKSKNINRRKKIYHNLSLWLSYFLCIMLVPILVANLVIIVKGSLNPDNVPTFFGYAPMAVVTDSMKTSDESSIKSGDLVIAEKIDPQELDLGDIIMFKKNQSIIIHRIIEKDTRTNQFITKGDANNIEDPEPVEYKEIVGKYAGRVPILGNLILFSKTPFGMLCVVGIPVCIYLIINFILKKNNKKVR